MNKTCPRCGRGLDSNKAMNALSRYDNKTYICSDCGTQEALQTRGKKRNELEIPEYARG